MADRFAGGLRRLPAVGTPPAVTAIFGDVRRNGRQFRHLMAAGITDVVADVEAAPAMPTGIGSSIDDRIHPRGGNQRSPTAPLPAKIEAAYHKADLAIQHVIDLLAA